MAWPTSGFPTSLDTITDKISSDDIVANDINGAYDCIEKMEAKIGVDSSAVVTSLDYLLKNAASSDPGHVHTLLKGATDVTAAAAELNLIDGSVAGTAVASKALVLGANKNVDVLAVADLKLGAGAGTSLTTTAAKINTICITGAIFMWPTETVPTGYLECNGASLDRTTYADLFAVIGTIYGTADGSHFNLPDYRGYFLRGWDHAVAIDPDRATRTASDATGATMTLGDHVGTEQAEGFKAHTHTHANLSAAAGADPGRMPTTGSGDLVTGSTGGNETRPININIMFIIKI